MGIVNMVCMSSVDSSGAVKIVTMGVSMSDLVKVGAYFGHRSSYVNPKMLPYIYGTKNGVHIIDMSKTVAMLRCAADYVCGIARNKGRVLFVGTKMQASDILAKEASRCGQFYVNHCWRGGLLTNFSTVSSSVAKLAEYEDILQNKRDNYTKKELLWIDRKRAKLQSVFGGIRGMGGLPDVIFVIDAKKESVAVLEANKLKIPVVAVVDTNTSPIGVDYIIPGNDDSTQSIQYYCTIMSDAILSGIEKDLASSGVIMDDKVDHNDS